MHNVTDKDKHGIRSSCSFHTFLQETVLPPWYPLSNMTGQQNKILSILQVKKHKGGVEWKEEALQAKKHKGAVEWKEEAVRSSSVRSSPMRVGVVGGGLSGLACCWELLRSGKEKGLRLEVTLLEGRPRVGGRVYTDGMWGEGVGLGAWNGTDVT